MPWAVILMPLLLSSACWGAPLSVPNSSFELDEDADGIPDGWQPMGTKDLGSVEIDASAAKDGERSVKLTGTSADCRMWLEGPRLAVQAGESYLFECWIKSEGVRNGGPVVGVARLQADGTWDNWSYVTRAPANTDWQLYRDIFHVPATTATISPRIWIERLDGTAWFDGLKISEYAAGTPGYVEDLSDTSGWQVAGGVLEPQEGALRLSSRVKAQGDVLFPVASMRRPLPGATDGYPVLKIQIGAVEGLWALKVRERGYLQQAHATGGTYAFDLRELEGTRGGPPAFIELQALGEGAKVTVKEVSLLETLPPKTQAVTPYTDHYVQSSGSVEGLNLQADHPYVAISQAEVQAAKERGAETDKWLAGTLAAADKLCEQQLTVPDQGYVYSMEYNCPEHGVPLTWRQDHPHEHLCPIDQAIITGPKFDREWHIQRIMRAHRSARSTLRTLGLAYAFTGEDKYAKAARDILVDYADKFPNYLWHSGRGGVTPAGNGMRVSCEALGEAGWLAAIAQGYDLVAASPVFTQQEHEAVKQMLREDVKVSLRYDERLSNRQCHHNLAVAAVGLCLQDETLVRRAVGSLRHQLRYGVLGDGFWWECSPGYHYYAMNTLMELVRMLKRVGLDLSDEPKFRLGYDGLLGFLFPDGTLPGVNDASYQSRPPWASYDYLYSLRQDPAYVPLLEGINRSSSLEYLIDGKDLGQSAPLPDQSHLMFKSGMAMLKAGTGDSAIAAAFDWGQSVAGHGHADKLNIALYMNGQLMAPDNGSRSYFSPVWRFWDRQTLSHNTVVVNERSQLHRKGRLELFDAQPGFSVCQATANQVYPGLRQRRTLFVTDEYVVDIFRVAKESTDLELYEEPLDGIAHWRREPWGGGSPESLARDFAHLERSTQAHTGKFSAMIGNTTATPAGWATNLRETTGPNSGRRYGVMSLQGSSECRFSLWVKAEHATGTNTAALRWLSPTARVVGAETIELPRGTEDWQQIERRVTAPASAAFAGVGIHSSGNSGRVWVDDIKLVPVQGDQGNLLTRNCDFETVDEPVRTIDWTYHNFGSLTSSVPLTDAEFNMGADVDEPHEDGENGYRYMRNLRAGPAGEKPWTASWLADERTGRGAKLTMIPEPDTQIIAADGQGPGTMSVPVVIARRTRPDTVFGAVLEPLQAPRHVRHIRRLSCTSQGKPLSAAEGYGIEVGIGDRLDYFLVSYTASQKEFGPVVLTPGEGNNCCVAALSVAGSRMDRMYVLGGHKLQWGKWAIEGPGRLRGEVISQQETHKQVQTDVDLPPGEGLQGSAMVLDPPYNVSLSIDSVANTPSGSTISLAGIPNLWIASGTRFAIPSPALLSRRAGDVFICDAPAGTLITAPNSIGLRTVEYEDPEGKLLGARFRRARGECIIPLRPEMLGRGSTYIVFNRPAEATIADRLPPELMAVFINGEPTETEADIQVPFAPREVAVDFQDLGSALLSDCATVYINGVPERYQKGFAVRVVRVVKAARVTVTTTGDTPLSSLRIDVADNSLLRNTAAFTLRVVRALEVVTLEGGGKAVKFIDPSGYLQKRVSLPRGEYTVNVVGSGPSLAANSLWLDIDAERLQDPFHLPVGELGDSSREVQMTDELPRLSVTRPGRHVLRLSLREGVGPVLDRLEIRQGDKVVQQVECEDMLP